MEFRSRCTMFSIAAALVVVSATWGCGGPDEESTSSSAARPRCKGKNRRLPECNVCGDGICGGVETCGGCEADCGACPVTPTCGDGVCDPTEACDTCSADCGACTTNCSPLQPANGTGNHNPGTNCAACHDSLPTRRWTVAGTLYDTVGGTRAIAGATIRVVDAGGLSIDLVTAENGNFYTTQAVTFPLMVAASLCPDTVPMGSQVNVGSCNSCHVAGFRIHVP